MTITNAKVTLDGTDLQVNTNGVRPRGVTIVDEAQPWLSREKIVSTRNDDDSLGFDVTTLSGQRIRVKYGSAEQLTIPANNATAIDELYKKYMHVTYELSGEGMLTSEALGFYNTFSATQELWAQLGLIKTKLADPDIPVATRNSLVTAYNNFSFADVAMDLILYGTTYSVIFAEGQSCQFTDWVIGSFTDFQFTLMTRTVIIP